MLSRATQKIAVRSEMDLSLAAKIPIQLVTLGPSFDKERSDTQSVKLTFSKNGIECR